MTLNELRERIPRRTLAEVLALHAERNLVGPMFLSNKDYHASPGLSKSALDLIEESPKFYQYCLKNPDNFGKDLIIGMGYHALILKDEELENLVYFTKTQPTDPKVDDHGRLPLSDKNHEMIKGMSKVFHADRLAPKLLENALIEVSFFWTDKETGILCKCKPDIWNVEKMLVIDIKSASDISEEPLKRAIRDHRYHVQGAFFIDGIRHSLQQAGIDLKGLDPTRFALCAQEKAEPFDIGFRPLGPRTMVTGEMRYRANLETYARCVSSGEWPGKSGPTFVEIELNPYDLTDWQEGGV